MATYYVRPDGNDSNTGLGSTTVLAWATVTKAIGATGVGVGDTVYFAPGTYRGSYTAAFTNPANSGQRISFIGDPTASLFTGLSTGPVIWTNYISNTVTPSGSTMLTMTKDFVTLQNICLQGIGQDGAPHFGRMMLFEGQGHVLTNCNVTQIPKTSAYGPMFYLTAGGQGPVFTNCQFWNAITVLGKTTATAWNSNTSIKDCLFLKLNVNNEPIGLSIESQTSGSMGGVTIANCTVLSSGTAVAFANCSTSFPSTISNCFIYGGSTGISASLNNGQVVQTYNSIISPLTLSNVATSATTATNRMSIIDSGYTRISGLNPLPTLALLTSTYGINAGINTYSPATDMYGVTWSTPTTPTIGSIESVPYMTAVNYLPTERNASTITIAPGSTSQSIELYLGATGLTASTSGLSARYNRTRTASVSIPLVARTIAQAWTAGGFAEVDATNMPGVYRLDVPDAALAAGADDVTIVVRGASGTNGAVMTIKLSSGGLTSAQTAAAVWDAPVAGYNTALDFGGVINETRNSVGATEIYVQGVASDVWNELKVNHTIPNTFGDYLDTKVSTGADTARIQLRQGPFLIKQNAIDSVITEVNQFLSTVPNIEMVLIDSSGGSVSVAGATLVMRVRNQAGTAVVNNITPTVAYADGGVIRWSPNLSWNALTVTTPGTYRIVVERTMSGVTTTFGPFLVQLSSG